MSSVETKFISSLHQKGKGGEEYGGKLEASNISGFNIFFKNSFLKF